MSKEIIERINKAKVSKERKWMYNFAKAVHKCIEENDFTKLNKTVNNYYKHHAEGYFNKTYRNMSVEEKKKYNLLSAERMRKNNYNEEKQKKMYAAYQLYKKGKLSKKSKEIIDKTYEDEYL
jgi:hypothetical protein